MEEALLGSSAGVGTENHFPGPGLRSGERMHVDVNGIVNAVELDRFPRRRINHARMAEDRGRMPADRIDPVEAPDFTIGGRQAQSAGQHSRKRSSHFVIIDRKSTRLNSSHLVISYA